MFKQLKRPIRLIDVNKSRISVPAWNYEELARFYEKDDADKFVQTLPKEISVKIGKLRRIRELRRWVVYRERLKQQ